MQRYRPQLSFLLLLVLWYGALDWVYRQVSDQLLADRIYRWGINEVAADIINALHSDAQVSVDAHRLVSPRATLEVVRGCGGSGLLFLLVAAVLAFSASWRRKLVGLAAATAAVYVLNELRIVALYLLYTVLGAWPQPDWRRRIVVMLAGMPGALLALALTAPFLLAGKFEMLLQERASAAGVPRAEPAILRWMLFTEGGGRWLLAIVLALIIIAVVDIMMPVRRVG